MKKKNEHEPKAKLMSAAEAWDDADRLSQILRRDLLKSEPVISLQVPFSSFLSALEAFNRDELKILRKRVNERLAV